MRYWIFLILGNSLLSSSASAEVLYSNVTYDLGGFLPQYATGYGVEAQDDFIFSVPGSYQLTKISVVVYGGTEVNSPFQLNLYDANKSYLGSYNLSTTGLFKSTESVNFETGMEPVIVDKGYVGLSFSEPEDGWWVYGPPTIGTTLNKVYINWDESILQGAPFSGFGLEIEGYQNSGVTVNGYILPASGSYCYLEGWEYSVKIIQPTGSSNVVDIPITSPLGANGQYQFQTTTTGYADICVKLNNGLSHKFTNVDLSGTVNLDAFEVYQPDILNDDVWDDFELNEINGGFGTYVTPGSGADYNCDGIYDDFDLNQINGGFGTTGECFGL